MTIVDFEAPNAQGKPESLKTLCFTDVFAHFRPTICKNIVFYYANWIGGDLAAVSNVINKSFCGRRAENNY